MVDSSKVALVHNWLTVRGGSENVLFELAKMYPKAPIYALVYDPDKFPELSNRTVITSWLQRLPWLRWHHELFPPLRYLIWRFTKIEGFDLVITNSSSENKAVQTPGAFHLAYIHTPPHYYWRFHDEYLKSPGFGKFDPFARFFLKLLNPLLRRLDYKSAQNPDYLLVNSRNIQAQVKRYYDRDSQVLYPPVDTNRFMLKNIKQEDFYLAFGRQTVFKRFDLIIDAFNELGLPLKIAGTGPEHQKLMSLAKDNVNLLGYVSDTDLAKLVNQAKACIFANEEDFGITWVESMAAGTPAICYGSGGALETVIDGQTGVLFSQPTKKSLIKAIGKFNDTKWQKSSIRSHALQFSKSHFLENLAETLSRLEYRKG